MPEIEERIESLETLLGRFILHTDMSLNRLSREVDKVSKEVDKLSKEMHAFREQAEKDRQALSEEFNRYKEEAKQERIEMNRRWGELANKMGTLVEDMVIPNMKGILKRYFDCEEPDYFASRVKKRNTKDKSRRREFDVIATCNGMVIVNETKSIPRINYIDDFIEALKEFYDYFPEYMGKRLIPIFASLYIEGDVIEYLTRNRIYAMAIKEETMDLLNFEDI